VNSLTKFGVIVDITKTTPVSYVVRLENVTSVKVLHTQLRPRPKAILSVGTRLSVYEIDGTVKWASVDKVDAGADTEEQTSESELVNCKVVEIDKNKTIVSFEDEDGEIIRIRFSSNHDIWKRVRVGLQATIEIRRTPEGDARYIVYTPDPSANKQKESHQKDEKENKTQTKDKTGQNSQKEDERETPISASQIGIDKQYFYERQKEGHRHEIMAFLAEHLHDDVVEWYRMKPKKDARVGSPIKPMHPMIERAIKAVDGNFQHLFHHQARALDSIRADRNLIVVTQTASGKTLCYNPAIFEHFAANDISAHALYIFPLNALLMDQKEKLDDLQKSLEKQGVSVNVELLVGGLGTDKRHEIARTNPQILAINPELLSWILQEPDYWRNFFSGLKYVVVDEVHTYRGILGLHMAGIIRRLLLQARRLGSEPKFILSSATVSNPLALATRLTSLPEASFDLLKEEDDGSKQAYKHWVVVNPDAHASSDAYDNYLTTTAMTFLELLNARGQNGRLSPLNTIVFARTIRDVNKIFKITQDNLRNHPHLSGKIQKYISAELNASEKRKTYQALKSGELLGIVSTNALGAGIDIGKLDACIIAGFPFSVMDMRQMAGRVGRRDEGLVVFVPKSSSSVDQYYRSDPELLLKQPPEEFAVDPTNPYISRKHINAAAYSLSGISQQELGIFGARTTETVEQAVKDKAMKKEGETYTGTRRNFSDKSDKYAISNIRSQAQIPYAVCKFKGECKFGLGCMDGSDNKKCEFNVAILDQQYAYRDCHPGAIYIAPDGNPYRSLSLDDRKHVIKVETIQEETLERTFVEGDISIKILDEPKARKALNGDTELLVGEVKVTRSFTGYYRYTQIPKSYCRRCRKEYEPTVLSCPSCNRKTSRSYGQSKSKRQDFPEPYHEKGFRIELTTIACWLKMPAVMETSLYPASPCKLPGEQNNVTRFLRQPLPMDKLTRMLRLSAEEQNQVNNYHEYAGDSLRRRQKNSRETLLFPGVYDQCLMSSLRESFSESRSLEIFQGVTNYPVTDNLKHVCRKCQTSVLLQALHTLEHTILMRYPSVALGDISDLGSYTRLGHPDTGMPTVFWYDNYDGGLGAAEKIFEKFTDLLVASERTVTNCSCHTLAGCPNCTHLGVCERQNDTLSKVGLKVLAALLLGTKPQVGYEPFVYGEKQRSKFDSTYDANEYVKYEHGVGEEAPQAQQTTVDPYLLLRIQKEVHDPVLEKAFEVRGEEISKEVPPVSVVDLNQAYQQVIKASRISTWNIMPGQDPYKILEILPSASLPMIQKIFRVIALQVHPDTYQGDKLKATEMMQLVNEAFNKVKKEKLNNHTDNDFDY